MLTLFLLVMSNASAKQEVPAAGHDCRTIPPRVIAGPDPAIQGDQSVGALDARLKAGHAA